MKIEIGKFYKTRDGRKAKVLAKDSHGMNGFFGTVSPESPDWRPTEWDANGTWPFLGADAADGEGPNLDLIAPWTAEDEVKRRKEAGEPPFKVGDRVHVWRRHFTVTSFSGDCVLDEERNRVHRNNCVLVVEAPPDAPSGQVPAPKQEEPKDSELEELVRRANAGAEAAKQIHAKFSDLVEFQLSGWEDKWWKVRNANYATIVYRLSPKPAFEPFTIGDGWEVRLEGETLHVGCQRFVPQTLLAALRDLCAGGRKDVNTEDGRYSPTRHGVTWQRRTTDDPRYTLSWADADRLLAALEKAFPDKKAAA